MSRPSERAQPDLRLPSLAATAWAGALLGLHVVDEVWLVLCVAAVGAVSLVGLSRAATHGTGRRSWAGLALWSAVLLLVAGAFTLLGAVRHVASDQAVMTTLSARGVAVDLVGTVRSDPRDVASAFSDSVSFRLGVTRAAQGVRAWRVREEVVLLADDVTAAVALGAPVRLRAVPLRGSEPRSGRTVWKVLGEVDALGQPDVWWRGAAAVRASLREVVDERPDDQRALVPSLVVGDDALVSRDLAEAFRTTGLTHLLAVSGTNLTLLTGVVIGVGRWCGVRGRWRFGLVAACIVGFVLVARSEPSVVRAATMGAVAVFALERHAVDRGLRCLSLAVLLVLAWSPWMAASVGLALSVLATAGILLLAPGWAQALEQWMPRWVALALAVPAAAQLACTPVVAAISGEVSLVAVLANVAAAPAVAPATVLGLLAGVVGLVHPGAGAVLAWPAAWSVGWIATVARWGAEVSLPAVGWGTGRWGIGLLAVLCVAVAWGGARVLQRPWAVLPPVAVVLWVVLRGVPTPGWPPEDWAVVACDVGQGDAVVVRTGERSAMVVDVGPEPRAVRRCLDRLDVDRVDLLVLTHFHADHVDGLEGVLDSRPVAAVEVTALEDPPAQASQVRRMLARRGLEPAVSVWGSRSRLGRATVERIWPMDDRGAGRAGAGGEEANDASVVLLVVVDGVRILLTGDIEPPAQARLARLMDGEQVDVLKVPHHGSRHQDDRFLAGVDPRVVLVSSGAGNTYGHPSSDLLETLEGRGARVLRTDLSGDVGVTVREGVLGVVSLPTARSAGPGRPRAQ